MELIGFIAGIFGLSTYIPQAYKTVKTQKTNDLSLLTLLFLNISSFLWIVYGIIGKLPAVWVTNVFVVILGFIILFTKIKNNLKQK